MSIIAVGMDSSAVALIMNRMGSYAKRYLFFTAIKYYFIICNLKMKFIKHSQYRFTSPLVLKNNPVTKPNFIEPGPLQLVRNGVCYVGEWLRLRPACSHFIRKGIYVINCPFRVQIFQNMLSSIKIKRNIKKYKEI